MDLRKLAAPRLVTWAASTRDLDDVVSRARAAGFGVFGPRDGSRVRPDGERLKWRSAGVQAGLAEADIDPVPFFIQWAAGSVHPSADAPAGCRWCRSTRRIRRHRSCRTRSARLGISTTVLADQLTVLTATLETPRGRVIIT